MCGIIGVSAVLTPVNLKTLKKVMIESRIRGKHASGIAWAHGNVLHSVVKPIPIDELVEEFDWGTLVDKQVSLIAHARYSTSDIRYNQPIVGDNIAIAMNGVITQSDPENWESLYGYKCSTRNDSELLLKAIESRSDIYEKFPDSSIAFVSIDNTGRMLYGRNGLRPLWVGEIDGGVMYASTYDILKRAGVKNITKVVSKYEDLQRRDIRLWKR